MISWIQKTFQQHFRTVFLVLLVLVIVAFVFTIGASPGIGNERNKAMSRPFFDLNLGSQEDSQRLFGDANISVLLRAGYPALGNEGQLQQYAFQRYAALHVADTLHVPPPTGTEFTDFLKTMGAFAGEDRQFDAKRYSIFKDNLKTGRGLSEADVTRVLADDYRFDKVQKLLAGPGYVLTSDVKQQLEQSDTKWTLALATADYTAFAPKIEPTDAELAKFFEENGFRYEIPRQARVRAVEFPASAFLDKVTVSDAEVRAFFDANPARFPKPATPSADGKSAIQLPAATAGTDADFAAVRPQVEAALKLERARTLASKAASDLTLALYEGKVARANVDGFLIGRRVTAKALPLFARDAAPAELGGSQEISKEAFKLNDERYYSDALTIPSGSVVLIWEETLSPRQPAVTEVRAKVLADYIENEKRKRFVEAGKSVRATIESKVKAGETFEKAVAASAGPLKLQTKTLPAFVARERPQDLDYSVVGALETLQKGGFSEMIISSNQGFIVHAVDKQPPAVDETNPRFVETRSQLAQALASRNANDYLRTLVEKELEKSAPVTR